MPFQTLALGTPLRLLRLMQWPAVFDRQLAKRCQVLAEGTIWAVFNRELRRVTAIRARTNGSTAYPF